MNKREQLRQHFRNWWNDYLTVDKYALDHGWSRDRAMRVLNLGRKLHNRQADELARKAREAKVPVEGLYDFNQEFESAIERIIQDNKSLIRG